MHLYFSSFLTNKKWADEAHLELAWALVISSVVIKTVQRVGNFSLWQISVLQPYCILYPCYWPYLDYDCSSTYSLYLCYIRSFPPSQDININMMPFVTEDCATSAIRTSCLRPRPPLFPCRHSGVFLRRKVVSRPDREARLWRH